VALDRWWPTAGTRRTGERNRHARRVVADGVLVPMALPAARRDWDFGGEHGVEAVEAMPFSEIVTLNHHLDVRRMDSWLGATALRDIRDTATPEPPVVDARGRSAQTFVMQVALLDARGERRATARGRDIYAVSAPLVVEAAQRLLDGGAGVAGATTLGAAFDARAMRRALAPTHFEWHSAEG
ncbi:MAG: saccharopine dehydrogenase, partial [Xanthomonadales bacterium]|nr:saccharopine dehydrogenase [Xanthomonadales bacterium]